MWSFEHSVECRASREFAWQFWTTFSNWPAVDSSVESVTLDGPFATGTKGTTYPRGMDAVRWELIEVQDYKSATIEIPAPGAVLQCIWTFEDTANGGARLTQRASIEGERADDYAAMGAMMEQGMPQAMQRMAEAIDQGHNEQSTD